MYKYSLTVFVLSSFESDHEKSEENRTHTKRQIRKKNTETRKCLLHRVQKSTHRWICDTPRSVFSPLCHPSARLVVRGPRLSKWLHNAA